MDPLNVFPLPLSDFEYCMYVDDSPDYPMTFCLQVHLRGRLHKSEFEASLQSVLDRHPLFRALVVRSWRGLRWDLAEKQNCPLKWLENSEQPEPGWINLKTESGIRVWVQREEQRSTVTVQIHHACCDGIGAMQFIGDLLSHYGDLTTEDGQPRPKIRQLDVGLLKRRGELVTTHKNETQKRNAHRSVKNLIHRFRRLVGRRTMVLAAPQSESRPPQQAPLMHTRVLGKTYCKALRRCARDNGASVNDLYLREMFLTLRDWNRSHGHTPPDEWFRIAMPVSMRTNNLNKIPACNMVSVMFLPRKAIDCEDAAQLLKSIHDQTLQTLTNRLGNLVLAGIRYARKIPGLLGWMMRRNNCFATSILANIGEARKQFDTYFPLQNGKCVAGNVILERLDGVAPIRPGTRMSVSLGLYASELIVNMQCDRRFFSEDDTDLLVDNFIDRLERLATLNPGRAHFTERVNPQNSRIAASEDSSPSSQELSRGGR